MVESIDVDQISYRGREKRFIIIEGTDTGIDYTSGTRIIINVTNLSLVRSLCVCVCVLY